MALEKDPRCSRFWKMPHHFEHTLVFWAGILPCLYPPKGDHFYYRSWYIKGSPACYKTETDPLTIICGRRISLISDIAVRDAQPSNSMPFMTDMMICYAFLLRAATDTAKKIWLGYQKKRLSRFSCISDLVRTCWVKLLFTMPLRQRIVTYSKKSCIYMDARWCWEM